MRRQRRQAQGWQHTAQVGRSGAARGALCDLGKMDFTKKEMFSLGKLVVAMMALVCIADAQRLWYGGSLRGKTIHAKCRFEPANNE